jgi:hypothetical protein
VSRIGLALLAMQAAVAGLGQMDIPPYTLRHDPSLSSEAARVAESIPSTVARVEGALEATMAPSSLYLLGSRDRPISADESLGAILSAMPDWAAGVALPQLRTVIMRVDRVGVYGQRQLTGVLAHETVHLLMAEAAGPGAVMPRWFREGVASNLARDGEWLDFIYLWLSPVAASRHPLSALEASFDDSDSRASRHAAYAGSYSFVRFLIERHSDRFPARVLSELRAGHDFRTAYHRATGTALYLDEADWSTATRGGRRWMAILTSSFTLWTVITLLFLLAYQAKRRRARRLMEGWQEDDPVG